jgi:plastocyanin
LPSAAFGVPVYVQRLLVEEFPLKRIVCSLLALLICCGCKRFTEKPDTKSLPEKSTAKLQATGESVISGHVFFTGVAPAPRVYEVNLDNACSAGHDGRRTSEDVLVNNDGGLQNVFVYISKGLEGFAFDRPSTPAVLDQRGCRFVPHVLGIQVGQPLRILNSDNTLHNVHAQAKVNKAFNLGMTVKMPEARRVFDAADIMIPIRCNVHPWMGAYIGVVDHPFYSVSDSTGFFSLRNVPAGEFTIEAWHEKFGKLSQNSAIGTSENKSIDFTFKTSQADSNLHTD